MHFSGHANSAALLFDKADPLDELGQEIIFENINKVLSTAQIPPKLVVLNACHSCGGSNLLLDSVDSVVCMSDGISDAAAIHFAARFYASIVGGQSVSSALQQAKIVLEVDSFEDHELPQLVHRDGVDPTRIFFSDSC